MHLLDTEVVAALRKARDGGADPAMAAWASGVARQGLFLSAISLHELEGQAARAGRQDRSAGALWRKWLDEQVARAFEGRVLAIDAAVVRRAAQLGLGDQRDALLAATALEHGLTLVTLRPRAFKASKARLFDPTSYVPEAREDDWRQASRAAPTWIKSLFVRS